MNPASHLSSSSSSSSGTTEKTLVEVLTQRSSSQRQLIVKAYEKATGRVERIKKKKKKTSPSFRDEAVDWNESKVRVSQLFLPSDSEGRPGGRHARRLWGLAGCPGDAPCCLRLPGGHQSHQGEAVPACLWFLTTFHPESGALRLKCVFMSSLYCF